MFYLQECTSVFIEYVLEKGFKQNLFDADILIHAFEMF